MYKKSDIEVLNEDFNQKKINHIFHYTDNFEILLKILRNGFAPSYCDEKINDIDYFIPMVSFCNIPLKDVDLYMRYGKYGIGMTLEWAVKNCISPVVYIHETTPFGHLHSEINKLHLFDLVKKIFPNQLKAALEKREDLTDYSNESLLLNEVNKITVPALQFFKNWRTTHKGRDIITYQEREWRYIPDLTIENRLVSESDPEFQPLKEKSFAKKPHLPKYTLSMKLEDIRYVLIKNDNQRQKVIGVLNRKYNEENVIKAILTGKLLIIDESIINNDF